MICLPMPLRAAACVALLSTALHAQQYTFTELARANSGAYIDIGDLNNLSEAVGTFHDQPFLWRRGTLIMLPMLEGEKSGEALGINDASQIVGVVGDARAVLWTPVGDAYEVLELFPGQAATARAINNRSQITGTIGATAFLWTDGRSIDLGTLGGGASDGFDLNDAGQVVGEAELATGVGRAFLYEDGRMLDLGVLPTGFSSFAWDINNEGTIVGASSVKNPYEYHAIVITNGMMADLAPELLASVARSVNDAGAIVGDTQFDVQTALLWQDGSMIELDNLLPKDVALHVEYSAAINNAGQILCFANAVAVLLTPADQDCNSNGVVDEVESGDCDSDGTLDVCVLHESFLVSVGALTPQQGVVISGAMPDEASGYSVAGIGDFNIDGFDDFIIGTGRQRDCPELSFQEDVDGGDAYVVFGGADFGSTGLFDLSALEGSNGFAVRRADARTTTRLEVSPAGDVNGDGWPDLLLGGWKLDAPGRPGAGQIYVVFGGPQVGASGEISLADLQGDDGFTLWGAIEADGAGARVAAAGDVNADGYGDILVSKDDDGHPFSYLIFGGPGPWPAQLDLAELGGEGSSLGVRLQATVPVIIAQAVSGLGDVNDDHIDDFILGAEVGLDGRAFVVFGHTGRWPTVLNVSEAPASEVLQITPDVRYGALGYAVSGAGDVNRDGLADILVNAPVAPNLPATPSSMGISYVVFGSGTLAGVFVLADLDGTNGFAVHGFVDRATSGDALAGGGDVDGDSAPDIVLAEAGAAVVSFGRVTIGRNTYLLHGGRDLGRDGDVELADLAPHTGFIARAAAEYDEAGRSVSFAGDVNGDGYDELLIGAPGAGAPACDEPGPGTTYLLWGRPRLDRGGDGIPDACQCIDVATSDPPNGAIDARQPFEPDGGAPQGWDRFDLMVAGAPRVVAENFYVTSSAGLEPRIAGVTVDGGTIEVQFEAPIPTGAWTTVHYSCGDGGPAVRAGFLPGDADNDRTSSPLDILALIDALNSVTPLPDYATDIDRSGQPAPGDILRLVDLLNGAGAYPAFNGMSLPKP
jgi:probable HAF family extracellular repeat protein